MKANRLFNGNIAVQPDMKGHGHERPTVARPLVEECIPITLAGLRQLNGRVAMLKAAEDARPVHLQVHGNTFSIFLLAEPHRVPNRNWRVSDRAVTRLWLICMGCRRKVRTLYSLAKFPGSRILLMPQCRACQNLTYQSQTCGGNKWWRETAMPIKRLLRKRERLLARKPSPKVHAQLEEVDQLIWIMRQRAKPRSSSRRRLSHSTGTKRPYRNLSPMLQSLPC
jgi:hypothetical protein